MLQLRAYQTTLVEDARALMTQGTKSLLITSPTGSGKTALAAFMLKSAAQKGLRSFFVVHRRELIKQSIRAFDEVGVRAGVVGAGFPEEPQYPIQVCGVQTLARRFPRLFTPQLIVWDEAHHVAAASWSSLFRAYPRAFHIGLTATPERLDGTGLGEWFQAMLHGPTVEWLIAQGYLSPYRLYAPTTIQTEGVHRRMGDFALNELAKVADRPTITGDVISHYQRLAPGKRAVVFCVSLQHSKHVVEQFQAVGIRAAHLDGDTPVEERDGLIKAFAAGQLQILSNVDLVGEGFDLPALEVAILLRPTESLGLYLQQVGRALRPAAGKTTAVLLDHAGNCQRHGLPDDVRTWSLDGRSGRRYSTDAAVSVRICPTCFAAQPSGASACQYCQRVFPAKPRVVAQAKGELGEVDVEAFRRARRQEQGQTDTFQGLVELGKRRGYKRPFFWAKAVWNARQSRKLAGVS